MGSSKSEREIIRAMILRDNDLLSEHYRRSGYEFFSPLRTENPFSAQPYNALEASKSKSSAHPGVSNDNVNGNVGPLAQLTSIPTNEQRIRQYTPNTSLFVELSTSEPSWAPATSP